MNSISMNLSSKYNVVRIVSHNLEISGEVQGKGFGTETFLHIRLHYD